MTVSGNPASFVVRGAAAKVNSLTVPFSPIQDLNGYSHPWPAGGGVNIWDEEWEQGSIDNSTGENREASTGIRCKNFIPVVAGESYYICNLDAANSIRYYYYDAAYVFVSSAGVNNSVLTIPSGVSYMRIRSTGTYGDVYKNDWAVNYPATATEYSPYENICPISGRTGLSVFVGPTTSQADATTYALDWTTEAGTVYGGTLDVVTGLLTVDMAYALLNDRSKWLSATGTVNFKYNQDFTDRKLYANSYDGLMISYIGINKNGINTGRWTGVSSYQFGIKSDVLTLQQVKDDAEDGKIAICYELATPTTYQLTPQEVELLTGPNNVWSDTDSVITIDYDVLSFIRQKFIVNGTDFSRFVERDSYQTSLSPVYGETVQTIDGVGHTARLRLKGALRLALNPQTDTDTAAICTELLNSPCEVIYHCLQRDADVAARMTIDTVSASFLSRCLYWGDEWNQIDPITLTEL